MQANGFAVKNNLKKQHDFIKNAKPLSECQLAAYSQLQHWLPTASFELFSRNIPDSVLNQYQVAVAEISESIGTESKLWVLASIPDISDTIFISIHQEYPKPFFDFIASLDAKSETADHMIDGFRGKIHHSVLENRGQKSFLLAQFQQLWPTPIFSKSKNSNSKKDVSPQTLREHNFRGCLVCFSENNFTKLNPPAKLKYELQAITRSSEFLSDIALPAAAYYEDPQQLTEIESAPISQSISEKTAVNHMTHKLNPDVLFKPSQSHQNQPSDIHANAISSEDMKALKKIRRQNRSYALFALFLVVAVAALVYLNFDTIDLHSFFN